jgi:membrane-associated phospholipid phosphatase
MEGILDFGIQFIASLQALGDWQTIPMQVFSFLGTEEFYMIALPVLYWCLDSRLGLRVAVILMLSGIFNNALKMLFHGPRPYWVSTEVTGLAEETSFGVPSGHAQNAAAIWGIMAAHLRRNWVWIIAILLMFFIGISRLYLAVHFPHDVLVGWLVGILLLWLTLRFWDPVSAWANRQTLSRQILFAFLSTLVLLIFPAGVFAWLKLSGWQAPAEWASFAGQAVSLDGALTSAGTLFGLLAGAAWLRRQGGFGEKGPAWKLVLRYLLGVAGVLAIRFGLGAIFPEGETLLAWGLRYLRYALIGFWVTGGAPWIFIKLKLASKQG